MTHVRQLVAMAVSFCCIAGFSVVEAAGPTVTQIVPSSGTGGTYLIAVLSDGFTDAEHQKFNDAADWIFNVQTFNDDFYKAHKSNFTVKTVFRPAAQSGDAQYGISASGDFSNCYIATTTNVDSNVFDATATLNPPMHPIRTVIIANDVYSNGCTRNSWTYVWTGEGTSVVLEHELGHLIAGLLDEYSSNTGPFPPGGFNGNGEPNGPNCSTLKFGTPPWSMLVVPTGSSSPGTVEGCDYYALKIWRPYSNCRMRTMNEAFCIVCANEMSLTLQDWSSSAAQQSPAPPSPIPEGAVQLLVEINLQSRAIKVLKATEVAGPTNVRQRLIGTYAWEIRDGDNVTTGVLAGNPFESRAYDGRGAGHPAPIQSESATVMVQVPRTTLQNLLARGVLVTFYKLDATRTRENITPARLNALTQQNLAHSIGALTPSQMRTYLQELTRTPR